MIPTTPNPQAIGREPVLFLDDNRQPPTPAAAKKLAVAYKKAGEPDFFLAGESGVTGIYGPDARWLIPAKVAAGPRFDRWVRKNLAPLVTMAPAVFDTACPRTGPDAPDLPTFYHTGDIGDIIASLPIMRAQGAVDLAIGNHTSNPAWRKMEGARFEALRPLLAIQPYIHSVRFAHLLPSDYELEFWRSHHTTGRTLTESQADYLKLPTPDMSPWLTNIDPLPDASGDIVVNRTMRYHNHEFPWANLVRLHHRRMVFIGTPEEHRAFCQMWGFRITYRPTKDFLEVARLIAGSALFIGNQSSACWVAMGMGHALIQETSTMTQDSIVPRANAQFFRDRSTSLRQPEGLNFTL